MMDSIKYVTQDIYLSKQKAVRKQSTLTFLLLLLLGILLKLKQAYRFIRYLHTVDSSGNMNS